MECGQFQALPMKTSPHMISHSLPICFQLHAEKDRPYEVVKPYNGRHLQPQVIWRRVPQPLTAIPHWAMQFFFNFLSYSTVQEYNLFLLFLYKKTYQINQIK